MFSVLVVDDDHAIRQYISLLLRRNGYQPHPAQNGREALQVMESVHIDLVVLDIMMPDMDGLAFTAAVRETNAHLPILMVSAKNLPEDKRRGFLVGTDDYLTKPFDEEELLLRIHALLRRAQIVSERKIVIGDVVLRYDELSVTRGDEVHVLPQKEFYLLYKLLSYPGKIFTRLQLMNEIWGYESESDEGTIKVHINRLRNRFQNYPEFELVTVRGLGYKAVKRV